jgi:rusticyanin
LLIVVIGLAGVYLYEGNSASSSQQAVWQETTQHYPPGMMTGYGNVYGEMMGQGIETVSIGQSVTIDQAIQAMRQIPSYARVDISNNTIVFESQHISILVLALMPDEAVNITGRQPPGYATDDVFVICGLINPTLVMRSGSLVQFTFVNLDDDMYHNLVVSSYGPPYGYMPMQGMMSGNWMPYLPPADYSQGSAHEYSYVLPIDHLGALWYLCTYPDHAQSGMYGKVIVTN